MGARDDLHRIAIRIDRRVTEFFSDYNCEKAAQLTKSREALDSVPDENFLPHSNFPKTDPADNFLPYSKFSEEVTH